MHIYRIHQRHRYVHIIANYTFQLQASGIFFGNDAPRFSNTRSNSSRLASGKPAGVVSCHCQYFPIWLNPSHVHEWVSSPPPRHSHTDRLLPSVRYEPPACRQLSSDPPDLYSVDVGIPPPWLLLRIWLERQCILGDGFLRI